MLRTIAILLAAAVGTSAQVGQSFPNTNKYGRATISTATRGSASSPTTTTRKGITADRGC